MTIKFRIDLLTIILLFLTNKLIAQQNVTDGPYVFYRDGRMIIKRVIKRGGTYVLDSINFPVQEKLNQTINIEVEGHPDWNFTLRLRDSIVNEPSYSKGADKVFAVSDIEGEFEPFRNLLLQAGGIDKEYNWLFGKGSLMVAGDLFDRGKQVSQYLWLLYKLEDEAKAKGGAV